MNKNIIAISIGILILILFLFIGFPLEFKEKLAERIARIIISISLILIFFKLFQLSNRITLRKIRILITFIIAIMAIPYLFICIYNFSSAFSNNYARWKDISVYEDKNGNKYSYQLRETSGSLYDYRYRKIYYENNSLRISRNCDFGKETGWSKSN